MKGMCVLYVSFLKLVDRIIFSTQVLRTQLFSSNLFLKICFFVVLIKQFFLILFAKNGLNLWILFNGSLYSVDSRFSKIANFLKVPEALLLCFCVILVSISKLFSFVFNSRLVLYQDSLAYRLFPLQVFHSSIDFHWPCFLIWIFIDLINFVTSPRWLYHSIYLIFVKNLFQKNFWLRIFS